MSFTLADFLALALQTLRDPKAVARRLMQLDWPMRSRWEALFLVLVLTTLGSSLVVFLTPPDPMLPAPSPFGSALVQVGVVLLSIYAVHHVGQSFGGTGTLGQTVVLMAWLQAVMLLVQLVQIVVVVAGLPLAGLVLIGGIVVFLYLLVQFIMVLHGFASALKVLGGTLATMFALGFVASLLAQMVL